MNMIAFLMSAAMVLAHVHAVTGPDPDAVLWWGHLAKSQSGKDVDAGRTSYEPDRIHGPTQKWASILQHADAVSMFQNQDREIRLFLTDDAVYTPPNGSPQTGLRRTELVAKPGLQNVMKGVTTFHFSLQKDDKYSLNATHEYQLVFIENDDVRVFAVQYGTPCSSQPGSVAVKDADTLRLVGNQPAGSDPAPVLFMAPFTAGDYHNFAITIDWTKNTLAAYYSTGFNELQLVVPTLANKASPGEFHLGMVKLPIGPTDSILTGGYQESGIRESLMFGGVFVEDSSKVPVTTIGQQAIRWQGIRRQHNITD